MGMFMYLENWKYTKCHPNFPNWFQNIATYFRRKRLHMISIKWIIDWWQLSECSTTWDGNHVHLTLHKALFRFWNAVTEHIYWLEIPSRTKIISVKLHRLASLLVIRIVHSMFDSRVISSSNTIFLESIYLLFHMLKGQYLKMLTIAMCLKGLEI